MIKPLSLIHILAQYKFYLKFFLYIMFFSGMVVLVTLQRIHLYIIWDGGFLKILRPKLKLPCPFFCIIL